MVKKLKICFVTEDFYPQFIGGQGIYGWKFVSQLVKIGHRVTVLAENRGERKEFWKGEKNIVLVLVPFVFGNQLLLALLEYFLFIIRLRNQYFNIVHANQLSGLFFALFKPANVGTVVISVHNCYLDLYLASDSNFKKMLYKQLIFLEKLVYQRADALLFHSNSEKNLVVKAYRIEKPIIDIIYPGVTPIKSTGYSKKRAHKQLLQDLKLPGNTQLVLCVARLVKRKRVDLVVSALSLLQRQGLPVCGFIIGDGPQMVRLRKIAPNNVYFLGGLSYKEISKYYMSSDLFVLVSLGEGGVSLAAWEAAAFGMPLILCRDLADPILKNGKNGYIINGDNPYTLSQKITLALSKRSSFGPNSQKMVEKLNWERCARETLMFYRLLSGKPSDTV